MTQERQDCDPGSLDSVDAGTAIARVGMEARASPLAFHLAALVRELEYSEMVF